MPTQAETMLIAYLVVITLGISRLLRYGDALGALLKLGRKRNSAHP